MRLSDRIAMAAESLLNPGETLEVATMCTFGNVSVVRKELATALLMAVATGGLLTVYTTPKMIHLVLTSRRLLVLDQDWAGNPRSAVTLELPRGDVRATPVKVGVFWLAYALTDKDGTAFARMSFALPNRSAGRHLAIALGAPVA